LSSYKNILVCVTQQKTCERLIKKANHILEEHQGQLFVLHVAKNEWNFLDNASEGEALEYLFGISKAIGANLTVLRSDNIVQAIVDFAKENHINCIILGESSNDHSENYFHNKLATLLADVEIKVIPQVEI
jgi:K+-sensing histidine kinase KdpD